MNFEEHAAKPLLAEHGIPVPRGRLVTDPDGAADAASAIGPCVVKAQVPTGKRGKAGGIRLADSPEKAREAAAAILGLTIDGHAVKRLLVEEQVPIAAELYAAVIADPASRGPMLLFSTLGGMDVEEAAEKDPTALCRLPIDIRHGLGQGKVARAVDGLDLGEAKDQVVLMLTRLYEAWAASDAELLEINPLVIAQDGRVIALDAKLTLDDSALPRQQALAAQGTPDRLTELEAEAAEAGLKYIELDGQVGVLANGAGLTMTTMDAIAHHGGSPANFLEIGGEAYTKAETALGILLKNPNIRSLLVNFCGAFARTDVMAGGVVEAWKALKPDIPVFFSIAGTGADDAITLIRRELGIEPQPSMDDAVRAAVETAR